MAADPNAQSLHQPLLPGLPDSVVLCSILPKLPLPTAAALRVVSRAWSRSLHTSNLISLRASLGVSQPFLLLTNNSFPFHSMVSAHIKLARLALFDPFSGAHLPIPDPCMLSGYFIRTRVETDGSNILMLQLRVSQYTHTTRAAKLCCFNLGTNRWYDWNLSDMSHADMVAMYQHTTRTILDGYLYLAGWERHVFRINYGEALRKALNGEDEIPFKMQWESLPPLNKQRYGGDVVAWKGKICMLGGETISLAESTHWNSSGEIWDLSMQSGGWTLSPELWPFQFRTSHLFTPSVGIIDGHLCAITLDDPHCIKYYEDHTKKWIPWMLSCPKALPPPRFFATGPTLWVLYEPIFVFRGRGKITISTAELHNDALGMKALKLPRFLLLESDNTEPSSKSQVGGPHDLTFDFPYKLSSHHTFAISDTCLLCTHISSAISI